MSIAGDAKRLLEGMNCYNCYYDNSGSKAEFCGNKNSCDKISPPYPPLPSSKTCEHWMMSFRKYHSILEIQRNGV